MKPHVTKKDAALLELIEGLVEGLGDKLWNGGKIPFLNVFGEKESAARRGLLVRLLGKVRRR